MTNPYNSTLLFFVVSSNASHVPFKVDFSHDLRASIIFIYDEYTYIHQV